MKLRKFTFVFWFSTVAMTSAGCSMMEEQATPLVEQKNGTTPEKVTASSKKANTGATKQSVALEKKPDRVALGNVQTYDLSTLLTKRSVSIAPRHFYRNDMFYYDLQENNSTIYTYNTKRQDNKIVYTTKHAIPMLTGTGPFVLWVETEKPTEIGVKWSIRQLETSTNQVTILDFGESREDTSPPQIDVTSSRVSWIAQEATEDKTISTLKTYSFKSKKITSLQSFILKTGTPREGLYTYEHRDSDDGLMLFTSNYQNGRHLRMLETLDGLYKQELSGVIDFRRNGSYIALATDGHVTFEHIGSKQETLSYSTSSHQTTIDGIHFLSNTQVIFREGINQLMYADLKAKTVAPLTDFEELISVPLFQDGTLSYSVTNGKNVTFHEINVLPET